MSLFGKLKCKLGKHDFKYSGEDLKFLPKVLIIRSECSRCPTFRNWFIFFDSGKVAARNFGINRFFGDVFVMPTTQDDYDLRDKLMKELEVIVNG